MAMTRTVCPHDCPDRCSIEVEHDAKGRILSLKGADDHWSTAGFLCGKVTHYQRRVYAQERVLTPLIRIGSKPSSQFRQASWDEALDLVTSKMQSIIAKDGAQAIAGHQGSGSLGVLAVNALAAFLRQLGGTENFGSICGGEATAGWRAGAGKIGSSDPLDVRAAKLIILWGCNAAVSNMHFYGLVREARAKGARLVVIDPYETLTARKADLHLRPFPGTDGALAMALINELHAQGAIARDYVEAYTSFWPDLLGHCQRHYSKEAAASITGLSPGQIEMLGDMVAAEPATFIRAGIGMSRHAFGGHATWAIASLATARGVFAVQGGGFLGMTKPSPNFNDEVMFSAKAPARSYHIGELGRSLLEMTAPAIKMLLVVGGNPKSTAPRQDLLRQGLLRADLFTVVHEQFLTDTTDYADVVFPASTFLEADDWHDSYGTYDLQRQNQVITPLGASVSSYEFVRRLHQKLGLPQSIFAHDENAAMEIIHAASNLPWTAAAMRDGRARHAAASPRPSAQGFVGNEFGGRFQFKREDFASHGLPIFPGHYEGTWGRSAMAEDQFHLMSPPTMESLNSSFAGPADGWQIPRKGPSHRVLISKSCAARLALSDGDEVELYNEYGAIRRQVQLTDRVQARLLVA